jgi:hypothetical protein
MMEIIVDKFNEIIYKACERYSKEEGLDGNKMQVLFSLDDEGEVKYSLLKEYRPFKEVTFNQILNVKIDFRGYSMIVPPFIKDTINKYSEKLTTSAQNLFVMCVIKRENEIALFLYNDKKPVEEIILAEIL